MNRAANNGAPDATGAAASAASVSADATAGPDGMGGDDMMRARRMLVQGDLRLLALALIAQAPRHGYEIIKLVEEKTADWYSPSPGIVYPTLTYLEEAGYVTASTEGSKKLYTITDEGKAYLDANRDLINVVLDRLVGARRTRQPLAPRRARRTRRSELPPLVEAAFNHLRETVAKRLEKRCRRRIASRRNPRPRRDGIAAEELKLRHCEEQSDEAIQGGPGLLRFARNDD